MYQSMSVHYTLENSLPLGVSPKHFLPSFDISSELCISSAYITSHSSVCVSGRTCHRSVQTFNSRCALLYGDSLISHGSQHV